MPYPLNDDFADRLGRWQQYAPWDASMYYDSSKGFLATQEHANIRNFRTFTQTGARPQTSIEASLQSVWDATTQTNMETWVVSQVAEPWTLSGTGLTSLAVGAVSTHGGWPGIQLTTNGAAVSATLTSSIANDNLDISALNQFILIFPDYNTFDGTSTVKLTSKPDGSFGTAAYESAAVAFSTNLDVMPQLRFNLSQFTSGAGGSFSLASVTGVQIVLGKAVAPLTNLALTIMGMRAVATAWGESALDFDTRLGAICPPVTLTGTVYGGTTAKDFEFLRGDGTRNDPVPADGAYNIYFYPGGSTSPNDATGGNYNVVSVLMRETKNIGAGTGSLITGRLKWNDAGTVFECFRLDMTGGAGGVRSQTTPHSESIGALDPAFHYLFRVELVGTQMVARLYKTFLDGSLAAVDPIWSSAPFSTSAFIFRGGRVGFRAQLLSRDSYVTNFVPSVTNYATLQTKTYTSVTPVNGARLAAVHAADENLFTTFTGTFTLDSTKTLSGNASYATSSGLTTNTFVVDDWAQTYLELDVWVGGTVTQANQPTFTLGAPSGNLHIPVSTLQANRWNHLFVDMTLFQDQLTGIGYTIMIQPGLQPDRALGIYWIDGTMVGRRRVSWAMRAQANGQWREFRDTVNAPHGALHLNPDERGTAVQLRANALTPDAWLASFKLRPHYAELGALV